MGAERWDEQVGTVADEAARLLESLRRTAAEAADAPAAAEAPAATTGPSSGHGDTASAGAATEGHAGPGCTDPFCQWCPLCRTSAVVRSLSPETLARLADLAGVAAAVLADLASARSTTAGSAPTSPSTPTPKDARPGRARPIPVRDADDPQEEPRG